MLSKWKSILLSVTALCIVLSAAVFAQVGITVFVDNEKVLFDVQPVIKNGRTMVGMRDIFEEMGFRVTWDEASKTVTGNDGETEIKLTIGQTDAYRNGEVLALEAAPEILSQRTMVPLRFVAESAKAQVDWNEETRIVHITSKQFLNRETSLSDAVVMVTTNKMRYIV